MRWALLAVVLCASIAEAQEASPPSTASPRVQLHHLSARWQEAQMNARIDTLTSEAEALKNALDALKKKLDDQSLSDKFLRNEIDDLKAQIESDVAQKQDLKKYVRKTDDKEFKFRFNAEVEERTGDFAFRTLTINNIAGALGTLQGLGGNVATLAGALAPIAAIFRQNNELVRPRAILRLYWEYDRFFSSDTYFFTYIMPEVMVFLQTDDIDRYILPRDFAHPRGQIGFIFKKAAIGFQVQRLQLSAGFLQFTYGSGFFVNPTNPFTPKNPLDPRREVDGVPAAELNISIVQKESVNLSAQVDGIAEAVLNDFENLYRDKLGLSALAMAKLTTPWFSLTGVGIYQSPNAYGQSAPSWGGILSTTPLGLTLSCEALWSRDPFITDHYNPYLIASFQAFINAIGANGTTTIVEYIYNGNQPTTQADVERQLQAAILSDRALLAADILLRPFARRQYATFYVEPSLTAKLHVNLSGLFSIDGFGALGRAGVDYDFTIFSLHAYGGATYGNPNTEFRNYIVNWFAELSVKASF